MKFLHTYAFVLLIIFLVPILASADTLKLKSGKMIEGQIISETDQEIKFDQGLGIPMTYYKDQIQKIYKKAPKSTSPVSWPVFKKKTSTTLFVQKQFHFKARTIMASFKFQFPIPRNDIANQIISDIRCSPKECQISKNKQGQDVARVEFLNVAMSQDMDMTMSYQVEVTGIKFEGDLLQASDLSEEQKNALAEYLVLDRGRMFKQESFGKVFQMILGEAKGPSQKAKVIYDFMVKAMHYQNHSDLKISQSPEETFNSGLGNCVDLAVLYVQLARLAGIPARVVNGMVFQTQDEAAATMLSQTGHTWAEVFFADYGWVPVDPAFGLKYPKKYFAFAYSKHIREFYGLAENLNSYQAYRGQIEISPFPGLGLPQQPVDQSQDLNIQLLSPSP